MKCARKEAGGFHPPLQRRLCGHMEFARKEVGGFHPPLQRLYGRMKCARKRRAGFTCPYIGEVGSQQCFSARGENKKLVEAAGIEPASGKADASVPTSVASPSPLVAGRRDAGSPPPSPHWSLSLLSGRQQRRTRLCEPDPEATGRTSGGLLRFITQPKQQEPHLFWLAVNGSHPARHRCLVPSRRAQIAPTFFAVKVAFLFCHKFGINETLAHSSCSGTKR